MGDILHMDAAEYLARFDDPARGAGADLGEGAASGAVDAREAEDVERQACCCREGLPGGFGLDAELASAGGGGERGGFVDPAAIAIAIDPCCGEIADPLELGRGLGDLVLERG